MQSPHPPPSQGHSRNTEAQTEAGPESQTEAGPEAQRQGPESHAEAVGLGKH